MRRQPLPDHLDAEEKRLAEEWAKSDSPLGIVEYIYKK